MKKLSYTLCFTFIFLQLCGCLFLKNAGQIADGNGVEDTSVISISDEEILSNERSSSYKSYTVTVNNKTTVKIGRFSGVKTIISTDVDGRTLTFTANTTLKSGNLRIVIVSDGVIIGDIDIGQDKKFVIENADGEYDMKIVGESAEFELTCKVD
jgi:hypothetical protein